MPDLRTDIQELYLLRSLRERATMLRNHGATALAQIEVDEALDERTLKDSRTRRAPRWISMQSLLEAALLVKVERLAEARIPSASTDRRRETRFRHKTAKLEFTHAPEETPRDEPIYELFPRPGDEIDRPMDRRIPVMLAALSLQVLASRSSGVLSTESMLFYYRVLFEFYVATRPDWTIGAARSGEGGNASAFVTNECIKAILTFERSFRLLVRFFERTRDLCDQYRSIDAMLRSVNVTAADHPDHPVTMWAERAIQRIWLDWYIGTAKARQACAIKFNYPVAPRVTFKDAGAFVEALPTIIGRAMHTAAEHIRTARDAIHTYNASVYGKDLDDVTDNVQEHSEDHRPRRRENAASVRAMGVIETALKEAERGEAECREKNDPILLLPLLAQQFSRVAREVHRVLDPSKRYVEVVLDRELNASGTNESDAGELAFAAASFGAISGWTQGRSRLQKACKVLSDAIPPNGILSSRRPFHATARGYKLFPTGCEITRSVSLLFEQTSYEFSTTVLRRIMEGLEEKAILVKEGESVGWNFEGATDLERPSIWVTAVTVLALQRIVFMLDRRINSIVFQHFNVITPDKMHADLTLNGLIYPDYGFSSYYNHPRLRPSIGVRLEEMRAHVAGVSMVGLHSAAQKPLYSAVLYGPPGTGKTTLAEALALSSDVPLITLSPFDLKTEDQPIEGRSRLVFEALSMLTRAVVLFDEFETVLTDRGASAPPPDSATRFLLTGLLPQLAQLHEAAQRQAVVYFVATNQLSMVDPAAIRPGRFDIWLPVYNPDPLSRAGTFLYRLQRFARRLPRRLQPVGAAEPAPDPQLRALTTHEVVRILRAVEKCRGLAASSLAEVLFNLPKWVTNFDLPVPDDAGGIDAFEELIRTAETDFNVTANSETGKVGERSATSDTSTMPISKEEQQEQAWLAGVEQDLEKGRSNAEEMGRLTPAEALKISLTAQRTRRT